MRPLYIMWFILLASLSAFWLLLLQYKSGQVTSPAAQNLKKILYWTSAYKRPDFYLGLGSEIFQNCTFNNCYTTNNRSHLPIEEFDALLFHAVEYSEKEFGKPERRHPRQMYVFFAREPPPVIEQPLRKYKNFYNWTMSYRLDADILRRYGSLQMQQTDYQLPKPEEIEARPKKIAWFVSRCNSPGKRELIAKELAKFIPVDVYGKCGKYSCPKKAAECYDLVEKDYKFYLSFENSVCQDYVTEKLFYMLLKNVVPVVYGGCDYDQRLPPNSVINVMDFKSVEDLAKYLQHLDNHTEEYLRFFDWKKDYVVDTTAQQALCTLCQKLNEPIESKVYGDVGKWYLGENNNKCSNKFIENFL